MLSHDFPSPRRVIFFISFILVFFLTTITPIKAIPVESPLAAGIGPTLVANIYPDAGHSDPDNLAVYNGKLYFGANDGSNGKELWESDGTTANTKLVKDIYPGTGLSYPAFLTVYNGKLYFAADDGTDGYELWESDGTPTGTKLAVDIYTGGANSSLLSDVVVYNGKLYFQANDGSNGKELWESDGTMAGTKLVKDINPGGANHSNPAYLTVYNGKLYFQANDGSNGKELWESDGTMAGTKLVKDINPGGANHSNPAELAVFNGKLYFTADDGTNGAELWESDGTSTGTKLAVNINPGGGLSYPRYLTVYNGKLYFRAYESTYGWELWESDGTEAGTKLVKDINPGGTNHSHPQELAVYNGKLYFQADDGTNGSELWESDGTAGGTKMVKDINPGGANHSHPQELAVYNGKLYFAADDGTNGFELWVYETSYIFADGFESGDTSAWSSTTGAFEDGDYTDKGKCKLCVDTAYALDGAYGLKVRVPNKKPHYLTDTSPNSNTRYRARFYIKAKGLKMAHGSKFKLFQGRYGKKQPFFLLVRKKGKKYHIRPYVRTDKGKKLMTKGTILPKKPSYVEIDWMAAESTTTHNGYIKLYINGKLKRNKAKVNNDKMVIDEIRLGVTQKIAKSAKISGAFYLDAFASDRLDYLGP